ncbi:hypothetical protein BO94DRAFT_531298 [Aspergillus sclerotioniger CBS 115572]|uniref:Small secreted protein n=1 Tax=Aspergillus sclerotioniger CBS 115572 TaxID=1450535 RepID=A0A317XA55_9EURO|nr:hypothetical protein BO94DRAFT_531298 [Aspergillus sclerotioniger CBS 115572]PWY95379.1 hypothetical protein BO94DRAFT_531298 [Aspergillus sclerotioniger CBS 115572]
MRLLTLLPIATLTATSLAQNWNISLYTDTSCTEYRFEYSGDQDYGCYSLETFDPTIMSIKAELPDGWGFMGSSGGACDDFHTAGGSGCWTLGQGFRSFEVFPMRD